MLSLLYKLFKVLIYPGRVVTVEFEMLLRHEKIRAWGDYGCKYSILIFTGHSSIHNVPVNLFYESAQFHFPRWSNVSLKSLTPTGGSEEFGSSLFPINSDGVVILKTKRG